MSRRNLWFSFSEWELIRSELKTKNNNSFHLSEKEIKEWKEDIQMNVDWGYDEDKAQYCFERCYIYGLIDEITNPRVYNIICREYWRNQDMSTIMNIPISFIGYMVNYIDDVDMDTPYERWEQIRIQMKEAMKESDKRFWFDNDLIKLYKEVTANQLVEA